MLYVFDQNNSGGSFDVDDKLCHRVVIEADSKREAEEKAFDFGVYYDGCFTGEDCPCCGDRWYGAEEVRDISQLYSVSLWGNKSPESLVKYGEVISVEKDEFGRKADILFHSVEHYFQFMADDFGWTSPDIRIFYKNGDVKEIFKEK